MKITRILSASVLAGAVLLSGTACSILDMGKKPDASTSASPAPTETTSAEIEIVNEGQAVADVVNGYYTYVLMPDSLAEIEQVGDRFDGRSEVTDEELNELVTSLPQGFQYFDTSNAELIKYAYISLLSGASVGDKMPGAELVLPAEAVTVEGDTATVNATMAKISKDGEAIASEADPYAADLINLKKNDSGSWVIVAEAPAK